MTAPGASDTPSAKSLGPLTRARRKVVLPPRDGLEDRGIVGAFLLDTDRKAKGCERSLGRPATKVQISMGSGFMNRTFTPLSWNSQNGTTEILAYVHGDAPACVWTRGLRERQSVKFFGPRRSLDLSHLRGRVVLFGDETCFGLALALRDTPEGQRARYIFEVSAVAESRSVLQAVGIENVELIERSSGDAHLAEVERELQHQSADGAQFVFAGKAACIQRVSRTVKSFGVVSSQIKAKAYWAPGKRGLD